MALSGDIFANNLDGTIIANIQTKKVPTLAKKIKSQLILTGT